jgi:hypothetical protein
MNWVGTPVDASGPVRDKAAPILTVAGALPTGVEVAEVEDVDVCAGVAVVVLGGVEVFEHPARIRLEIKITPRRIHRIFFTRLPPVQLFFSSSIKSIASRK